MMRRAPLAEWNFHITLALTYARLRFLSRSTTAGIFVAAFTTFRGCGDPNTVDSRVTATLKETISRAKERNTHQESLGNQKGDLAVRVCNLPLCNNWIYIGDPDKATPTEASNCNCIPSIKAITGPLGFRKEAHRSNQSTNELA